MNKKNLQTALCATLIVLLQLLVVFLLYSGMPETAMYGLDSDIALNKNINIIIPAACLALQWILIGISAFALPRSKKLSDKDKKGLINIITMLPAYASVIIGCWELYPLFIPQYSLNKLPVIIEGLILIYTGNVLPKKDPNELNIATKWTPEKRNAWISMTRLVGRLSIIAGMIIVPLGIVLAEGVAYSIAVGLALVILLVAIIKFKTSLKNQTNKN